MRLAHKHEFTGKLGDPMSIASAVYFETSDQRRGQSYGALETLEQELNETRELLGRLVEIIGLTHEQIKKLLPGYEVVE